MVKRDKEWAYKRTIGIRVKVRELPMNSIMWTTDTQWEAMAWSGIMAERAWGKTAEEAAIKAKKALVEHINVINRDWERGKEQKWHEIDINHL